MRALAALAPIIALAGCSSTPQTATYTCPNGPEIGVLYSDEAVTISYGDGRREDLPVDPSRDGFYAKPGLVWSDTGFRSGRLTDNTSSYACDQTSG